MTIYWLTQTQADLPSGNDWLAASESATLAGLRITKRRDDWKLGRWTAKRAIVAHLGEPPDTRRLGGVEIRAAESGAPDAFIDRQPAHMVLSISHSADQAVCTIAPVGVALGCDIETIAPHSGAFIADYFTDEERAAIRRTPAHDHAQLVTLLWSAKESALKALREGLRLDTRCVAVTVHNGQPVSGWRPLSVQHTSTGRMFDGWWRGNSAYVLTIVACPSPCPPVALMSAT